MHGLKANKSWRFTRSIGVFWLLCNFGILFNTQGCVQYAKRFVTLRKMRLFTLNSLAMSKTCVFNVFTAFFKDKEFLQMFLAWYQKFYVIDFFWIRMCCLSIQYLKPLLYKISENKHQITLNMIPLEQRIMVENYRWHSRMGDKWATYRFNNAHRLFQSYGLWRVGVPPTYCINARR